MIHQTALGAGFIPPSPPRPFTSSMGDDPLPCDLTLPDGDATILSSSSSASNAGTIMLGCATFPVTEFRSIIASSQPALAPLERARYRNQAFARKSFNSIRRNQQTDILIQPWFPVLLKQHSSPLIRAKLEMVEHK